MSNLSLKFLALATMFIDHLGLYFPNTFPIEFRLIGRISFPIFLFLAVESFHITKNRDKYIFKLLSFGFITSFINITLIHFFETHASFSWASPNIFISLGLSCFMLKLITLRNTLTTHTSLLNNTFGIIFIIALSSSFEYGLLTPLLAFTFFKFRDRKKLLHICYIAISLLLSFFLTLSPFQPFMLLAIIFIDLYNKKLSPHFYLSPIKRYFFYLFYVTHTAIFIVISSLI